MPAKRGAKTAAGTGHEHVWKIDDRGDTVCGYCHTVQPRTCPCDLASMAARTYILAERGRRNAPGGPPSRDPYEWLALLARGVGELAWAMILLRYQEEPTGCDGKALGDMRTAAVRVAAVALAMAEQWDREKGKT